ncbi:MAG: hypothetical protein QOI31_2713 [Solirubrobacterales bacterium]|nr:hypothetical protein [Solirubrobacterales bacterium]
MGLAGTLALLAATVAVLFGVALARDDDVATPVDEGAAAAPEPTLDSDELLELSLELSPTVARRVEDLRGLDFDKVPEPQVTDTDALRDLAEKQVAKPKNAETLAASDAELKLLGMLEPDESLAEVTTDVSADAAAYYDPMKKELFLLGDAVPAGPALAEFVLAHELNHALEDQAFGLPKSTASSDDAVLAESALVEGSATALMTEYAVEHLAVADLLNDSSTIESEIDLPDIAMAQVTFAYFGGQKFVDELREAAGGSWDLVDFAYQRRLPATTEQILHPEKYLEDEGALPVPENPDPGPGWEEVDDGTVGEFFTREILRRDAEDVGADEAAEGWGGDRYELFHRKGAPAECTDNCREDNALAIVWRSDDENEGFELRKAVDGFVERSLDGTPAGQRTWELDGGWAAVAGGDEIFTFALAPTRAMAQRLAPLAGTTK